MKKVLFFVFILLPAISDAQLNVDGKSEISLTQKIDNQTYSSSFLYSGSSLAPFGLKFQYCNNFGGYASFKTDFGIMQHYTILTFGATKSIGSVFNLYLGGGISFLSFNAYMDNQWREGGTFSIFEGGGVIKLNRLAFEIGAGLSNQIWHNEYSGEYSNNQFFLTWGIGFSL